MANYVTNIITFGTDPGAKAAFRRMLDVVRADGKGLGSISFEKLLPMPEYVRASMKPGQNGAAYGAQSASPNWEKKAVYPLWYTWSCENWGSKWDAVNFCPLDSEEDSDTMIFDTAWSPVPKVVEALSRRFPDQTVTYRWAENENLGTNVGKTVLLNGTVISKQIPEDYTREAFEMSADILGLDLADYGLYLSQDGAAYEYHEHLPKEKNETPSSRRRAPAR